MSGPECFDFPTPDAPLGGLKSALGCEKEQQNICPVRSFLKLLTSITYRRNIRLRPLGLRGNPLIINDTIASTFLTNVEPPVCCLDQRSLFLSVLRYGCDADCSTDRLRGISR
jgi:hypothetical protein